MKRPVQAKNANGLSGTGRQLKLLIADEHALFAEGIAKLLEKRFFETSIVSTYADFLEAMTASPPHLVIADFYLSGMSCIDAIEQGRQRPNAPPFLLIPPDAEQDTVRRAMAAGARGIIHRRCTARELRRAVDCILDGCTYVAASLMFSQVAGDRKLQPILTVKQRQILEHVALGMRARDIAERLNLSVRTVESHKFAIMRQLGVRSSIDMVRLAVAAGVLNYHPA